MAETLTNEAIFYTSPYALASHEATSQEKAWVNRSVVVGVDVAPSDTTIYNVPAGKTFYLTGCDAYTNNADTLIRNFYDSDGDAIAGTTMCGVIFGAQTVGVHKNEFGEAGIPFTRGITMSTADLVASKTFACTLRGYVL
jgi:hypothetical protein